MSSSRIDRRDWFSTTLATPAWSTLALGERVGAGAGYTPRVAAQAYIWLQHFQSRSLPLLEGLEEMFSTVKRAGFTHIELMPPFHEEKYFQATCRLLQRYDLKVPLFYSGGNFYEKQAAQKSYEKILQLARQVQPLGVEILDLNPDPLPRKERKSQSQLEVQARWVDRLGAELSKIKMRLALHQHDPEMQERAREWRFMRQHTNGKRVFFCLDIDWVLRGGEDPYVLLEEALPRLAAMHLRNTDQGVWMESLREGDIDYRRIAARLRQSGYQGWLLVELAYEKKTLITRSLEENLRLSRVYAESLFSPAKP